MLFKGTLRENIDFKRTEESDEKVMALFRELGFRNSVFLREGMEMSIESNGSNLS